MALISSKRKRVEDTHDDKSLNQSRKPDGSNHTPLLSGSHQSSDSSAGVSIAKHPRMAKVRKAKAVMESVKPERILAEATDSSGLVPTTTLSKAGTSKKVDRKHRIFNSGHASLDRGNTSIIHRTGSDKNGASITSLKAPSSPPLEEVENRYKDDEIIRKDKEVDIKRVDADSNENDGYYRKSYTSDDEGGTSETSLESASEVTFDSESEPHPDDTKKETVKADNPGAFASSMADILGYKLTRTQRANPILARSADAKEADATLLDMKLEKKAKAEMKKEKLKKEAMSSGYTVSKGIHGEGMGDAVIGVLPMNDPLEKALKKTAEKGVVKMFNAFAFVREKAVEAQRLGGTRAKKEEKATQMSKEGWLEYVGQSGKGEIDEKGKG